MKNSKENVTQVSVVSHGPLVRIAVLFCSVDVYKKNILKMFVEVCY